MDCDPSDKSAPFSVKREVGDGFDADELLDHVPLTKRMKMLLPAHRLSASSYGSRAIPSFFFFLINDILFCSGYKILI